MISKVPEDIWRTVRNNGGSYVNHKWRNQQVSDAVEWFRIFTINRDWQVAQ